MAGGDQGSGESSAARGATSFSATGSGGVPLVVESVPTGSGLDLRLRTVGEEHFERQSPTGGVLLQRSEGDGQWTTLGQCDLPPGDHFALPVSGQATRWVLLEPLQLEGIPREVAVSAGGLSLNQARHSREGDVTGALTAGGVPTMVAGDTLTAGYASVAEVAGDAPRWLLVLKRPSSGTGTNRSSGKRRESDAGLPTAFALHQNLPNPFAASTAIRFALPVASRVRIEVHDLLGRRVRTLTDNHYPAGEHQVEWDRRTSGGALAPPGLYFYRMEAGGYRDEERMVILP
jgi:hypothetical protein